MGQRRKPKGICRCPGMTGSAELAFVEDKFMSPALPVIVIFRPILFCEGPLQKLNPCRRIALYHAPLLTATSSQFRFP